MIKKRSVLIGSIIILITLLALLAAHPRTTQYLAQKFLKANGIEYSRIEGSLLWGFTIYDLRYTDALVIKSLRIEYDILMLLNPRPHIKKLKATELLISPQAFLGREDENASEFLMPAFFLCELDLSRVKIIIDKETLVFDLRASDISYKSRLDVKKVLLQLYGAYGRVKIEGKITSDLLHAKASINPKESLFKEHLSFLQDPPQTYAFDLDASLEKVQMHTHLDIFNTENNVSIQNTDLNLSYLVKEDSFTASASYLLGYDGFEAKIRQKALFTPLGAYTTELNVSLSRHPIELPFNDLHAEISGDSRGMSAHIQAEPLQFDISSKRYKNFVLHAKSESLPLSFITDIPEALKKNILRLKADAILDTSPFSLTGDFTSEGLYSGIKGSFELGEEAWLFQAQLHPKPKTQIGKSYFLDRFYPLNLVYYDKGETALLNVDANMSNLSLFKKEREISGWGNLGSVDFKIRSRIEDKNETVIRLSSHIPSLHSLISELAADDPEQKLFFDAEVDLNSTLRLSEKMEITSRIHLPWYLIRPDSQTSYTGEESIIESRLKDQELTVERYSIDLMDHRVYSDRSSKIGFDTNGTIDFKEFWLYDTLLLSGKINPAQMQGKLSLKSDFFHYEGKEGNLTLKADIRAEFERGGRQNIEGNLTLLSGLISYEPSRKRTISDDIIIIQDIPPLAEVKRSINLHINAKRPIFYKTKEMELRLMPDLTLRQEPNTPLIPLGTLTILDGEVIGGGRLFEFKKSEIHFKGATPVNPYLNLNLHHQTLDYINIKIFITNTMASPLIILSSNPALSQNDIMSYLLFGEPASSTFEGSTESKNSQALSSLLLATGLKQMLNDTTSLNIDTFNILTNEEGTLGYEIGARFNKQVRVVYKNDTVSSLILQYSLSREIRIDVDSHETGQGASIIYIKDF